MAKKKTRTLVAVVVDESGSMATMKSDAEGAYKHFLDAQRDGPGEAKLIRYHFSTVHFGSEHDLCDIAEAPGMALHPRGGTPLLDSVAKVIAQVDDLDYAAKANKIIVVITDGEENSSREFSKAQLRRLIEEKTAAGWDFVFLGANQDSFTEAGGLGFAQGNITNYNAGNFVGTMATASSGVSATRSSGVTGTPYFSSSPTVYTGDDTVQDTTNPDN